MRISGRCPIPTEAGQIHADLNYPHFLSFDACNNIVFSDYHNYRVRAIDQNGIISTVVGRGIGDDGPVEDAWLASPRSIAANNRGHLYISDSDHRRVRRFNIKERTIETVAGSGITTGGEVGKDPRFAALYSPRQIFFDAKGYLYIADANHHAVWKADFDLNRIEMVVRDLRLGFISGVAVNQKGELFIADPDKHVIWIKIKDKDLAIFAGTMNVPGNDGDGGISKKCLLRGPTALAVGVDDEIYVADTGNHCVRCIKDDRINLFAGKIREGSMPSWKDGVQPQDAYLNNPRALLQDVSGNVWIGDQTSVMVVERASNQIYRVAGTGHQGFSGDGGPALAASLNRVYGLALDGSDLYLVEYSNHAVRCVRGATKWRFI